MKPYEYIYRPYETGCITYPTPPLLQVEEDSALATMVASEGVLARDWDTPEEDAAWEYSLQRK